MRGLFLIRPLENALRCWEVECWVHKLLFPFTGIIPQLMPEVFTLYSKLREHLRRAWSGDLFDQRFVLRGKVAETYLQYTSSFPKELWEWMRVRRVYHLTDAAQAAFFNSSYKGITWGDIMFPFPSFGVALETPIVADDGHPYSFILVTQDEGSGTICLRLLSQKLDMIEQVTPRVQFEIERLVKQGRFEDAQVELKKKVYPIITDTAWVCAVGASWSMHMSGRLWEEDATPSDSRGRRKSPRPHPRQGVWCFKKGTKGKPGAAKVQWRRPTFVRANALAPGELPPGALVKLKQ